MRYSNLNKVLLELKTKHAAELERVKEGVDNNVLIEQLENDIKEFHANETKMKERAENAKKAMESIKKHLGEGSKELEADKKVAEEWNKHLAEAKNKSLEMVGRLEALERESEDLKKELDE